MWGFQNLGVTFGSLGTCHRSYGILEDVSGSPSSSSSHVEGKGLGRSKCVVKGL